MAETKEKDYQLSSLISDACDVYDSDDYDDMKEGYDDSDIIHEIADNAVPIYFYDIAKYAAYNHWLMTETPELNPNGNAHDQIQSNIYEAVCEGLYEHIPERQQESKH